MQDFHFNQPPLHYSKLKSKSAEIGFSMESDLYIGSLLKTLIASKPRGNFLELGTGVSLSFSWMVEGLSEDATLTTLDNDPKLIELAKSYFGDDPRLEILCCDGSEWINSYTGVPFDLIFADAWPGKYQDLDKTLSLVKTGGFYVIDDMSRQPNWPEGHEEKVGHLIDYLEARDDFYVTRMNWSTGVLVCVKHN